MAHHVLAAALAAILASSAAQAATYTFADNTGAPYCNSIRLSQTDARIAGGVIDGSACKPAGNIIGAGTKTRFPGSPDDAWSFGFAIGKYSTLMLLDEKALTWALYTGGRGTGFKLQETSTGILLRGRQAAKTGAPSMLAPH
jgi:hypothetical protein